MGKSICISREVYHNIRDNHIAPLLAGWQFKQVRKDDFYRVEGDTVWRILTDFARDGRLDQGCSSIALGAGFYSVSEFLLPFSRMKRTLEPEKRFPCMIAKSFNNLLPEESSDHVWIYPTTDPDGFTNAFAEDFECVGRPWFADFGSLEKCIAWWSHPENMRNYHEDCYLMAAWWVRGQYERALQLARQRVEETAAKLAWAKSVGSRYPQHAERAAEAQEFHDWLVQQPRSKPPES